MSPVSLGYNLYKMRFKLAIQDPLMGPQPRYHHILFLETHTNNRGHVFNVVGDLVAGMIYECRLSENPELDDSFHDKVLLGRVSMEDFPGRLDTVLRSLPPPPKQRAFNVQSMRMEQIKEDGGFYGEGEERPPFKKCTEWTELEAIPKLRAEKLIRGDLEQASLSEQFEGTGRKSW